MTINKPAGRVDYLAFFFRSCLLQGLQIKFCVDTVMCKKKWFFGGGSDMGLMEKYDNNSS